ncbi:MAG: hypothetical protein IKR60_03695, partial [Alphaproteobacteria bacterium]|nr:hypothetical protein [Alphaproteobacteria bacterium]
LAKAMQHVDEVKQQIQNIAQDLQTTQQTAVTVFVAFQKQMADYTSMFDERFSKMQEQNAASERQLSEMQSRYHEMSVGHFMDKLNEMVASLENLSIDLNRFFDKDAEDELWKKFYDGDHGAFAHHMVKKLGRKEILKIKDFYQKNADFRKLADTYLSEFEVLLHAAQNSEKPETLLAIISGAEVGKIYYIMARALDKLS